MSDKGASRTRGRWALWLLVIPFAALLFPGLYASADPRLSGIPFFIWYQFLWVFLAVAVTGLVYLLNRDVEDTR